MSTRFSSVSAHLASLTVNDCVKGKMKSSWTMADGSPFKLNGEPKDSTTESLVSLVNSQEKGISVKVEVNLTTPTGEVCSEVTKTLKPSVFLKVLETAQQVAETYRSPLSDLLADVPEKKSTRKEKKSAGKNRLTEKTSANTNGTV